MYEPSDYLAVMIRNRGTGKTIHEFRTADAICRQSYLAHLRAANAHGSDVYLSVNCFQPGTRRRVKANVSAVRHLFVDIDENGEAVVGRIVAELPRPWAILASSAGKYQVLWRVDGFAPAEAEAVTRGLAHHFRADEAVWDCARVLRLPGFRNCKPEYAEPLYVREVLHEPATRVYASGDFPQYAETECRRSAPGYRIYKKDGPDQSAIDWGLACAAAEKGKSESDIAALIIERRRGIKPLKPHLESYATRTARKTMKKGRLGADATL